MVVKMMRWRPWPPVLSKKYDVKIVIQRVEGWDLGSGGSPERDRGDRLTVEIRWKGPKATLSSLRRTVKRNFTKEAETVVENGVVSWEDEEFQSVCTLSAYKENVFHPWEISFAAFSNVSNPGQKNKVPIVGTAFLNLAEYASVPDRKEFELSIPLTLSCGTSEPRPVLHISLSLLELRTSVEAVAVETVERALEPVLSPPPSGETISSEKDELSVIKAGLRKVKIFTDYVSTRKSNKTCREEEDSEGRGSARSEDGDFNYTFDSDSLEDFEEGESDEVKEDVSVRKSFSYGTLAYANNVGGSFYSSKRINGEDEDWVYYSNHKSEECGSHNEDSTGPVPEPVLLQSSKRSLLPWRKRKLSFRSPKAKGEPLLKKSNGDEGGDDIDFDRRQLSSDEALPIGLHKTDGDSSVNRSSVSEFGDDSFTIGCWEQKEVVNRDGHMKLTAQIFFASLDQRSEQAAGESACTALVAVIADWFQNNHDLMPIKSQFDSLIRDGSLEWRNLCENETYMEQFPDKHFDLDTVLQAKIRPLNVVPGKSFIGFFHPEGMDEGRFDILQGAMSFDNIWDEISRAGAECPSNGEPHVYIVSWNDHFFILKVEPEAYYIIDTLGERLYEGCNQAYILKFDRDTTIHKLSNAAQPSDEKPTSSTDKPTEPNMVDQVNNTRDERSAVLLDKSEESSKKIESEEIVCRGKESCKEYIKSFLAAIPIRELQDDMKKGLVSSTPLHQRLQIECHYTQFAKPSGENLLADMTSAEVPITNNNNPV